MIVVVIPAKKDSGRLPGKNTLRVNGKSLIEYSVEYSRKSRMIGRIVVSTDSDAIAARARELGVEVILRDAALGGETPLIDVYRHAWKQLNSREITHIVGVQPDHPDRKVDLDEAISYVLSANIDELFTVDRHGKRNGSLRILSLNALRAEPSLYVSSIQDDCINIHTISDFHMARHSLSTRNRTVKIGDRRIGPTEPVFVIAEAACNHMCDIQLAKEMIDKAADAGVDAIKFQTYTAEKLTTKQPVVYGNIETRSQYEYYKKFDKFGKDQYRRLFHHAGEKGIVAFSTPFDPENAHMLNELSMPIFKIASCDLLYTDLLRTIGGFNKPVILSTGGAELGEVKEALVTLYEAGAQDVILMACTLAYPAPVDEANYAKILSLRESFPNVLIGMSDHVEPDEYMVCGAVYVALGARVVEKHYTLDRTMAGGGHCFSMEPADLRKWVQNIRFAERVIGRRRFEPHAIESAARQNARRSLVFNVSLRKGDVLEHSMMGVKRPGTGIMPNRLGDVVGKVLVCDVEPDTQVSWDMLKDNERGGKAE